MTSAKRRAHQRPANRPSVEFPLAARTQVRLRANCAHWVEVRFPGPGVDWLLHRQQVQDLRNRLDEALRLMDADDERPSERLHERIVQLGREG